MYYNISILLINKEMMASPSIKIDPPAKGSTFHTLNITPPFKDDLSSDLMSENMTVTWIGVNDGDKFTHQMKGYNIQDPALRKVCVFGTCIRNPNNSMGDRIQQSFISSAPATWNPKWDNDATDEVHIFCLPKGKKITCADLRNVIETIKPHYIVTLCKTTYDGFPEGVGFTEALEGLSHTPIILHFPYGIIDALAHICKAQEVIIEQPKFNVVVEGVIASMSAKELNGRHSKSKLEVNVPYNETTSFKILPKGEIINVCGQDFPIEECKTSESLMVCEYTKILLQSTASDTSSEDRQSAHNIIREMEAIKYQMNNSYIEHGTISATSPPPHHIATMRADSQMCPLAPATSYVYGDPFASSRNHF